MSHSTRFDPQFSSISFGRRDKALYPNVVAPFDAAALEALGVLGGVPRSHLRDDDRASGSEDDIEIEDAGSEEGCAEGAEDEELGRRLLLRRDSGYDAEDERPCKRSKIRRSAERHSRENPRQSSLEIAKNISREFDQKADDRASIFPDSPKDAPYLPASEARRAALINALAVFVLGHKDRSVADGRWNSIYTPASPPPLFLHAPPMLRHSAFVSASAKQNRAHYRGDTAHAG